VAAASERWEMMAAASESRTTEASSFGDARSCYRTRSLCRRDGRSEQGARDLGAVLGGLRRKPRADEASAVRLSLAGPWSGIEDRTERGEAREVRCGDLGYARRVAVVEVSSARGFDRRPRSRAMRSGDSTAWRPSRSQSERVAEHERTSPKDETSAAAARRAGTNVGA
jgi:hypothetical protein